MNAQQSGLLRLGDSAEPQVRKEMMDVEIGRAAQQVMAQVLMARRLPRNQIEAYNRIMEACKRPSLAKRAEYAFPRGKETVKGPTIQLAVVLAREWGNVDYGIVELEQRDGESKVESFCWDIETNVRATMTFTVKHQRKTKRDGIVNLDDPRDIYEMAANQGARRLRACILRIIPGDVVDEAIERCRETAALGSGEPLVDRIRKMVVAFHEIQITKEMIEARLGHGVDLATEGELSDLSAIFNSIHDKEAKREDFFGLSSVKPGGAKLSDEDAARQIELIESVTEKWKTVGFDVAQQIDAIRKAGGAPTPRGDGGIDLTTLPLTVLSKLLE